MRLPPLESLRVFEACARRGSFTRGADELGVTPTAVSLRVRALERDLGSTLFERSGPRVTLTHAGEALSQTVGEALMLLRSGVDACRQAKPALRLSVTPTFAMRWLIPRLAAYRHLDGAATITLDVSTDLRSTVEFDLAIRSGRGGWPGLRSELLMSIRRTPMFSRDFAERRGIVTPSDLLGVPLVQDLAWVVWFDLAGVGGVSSKSVGVEYATQDMAAAAVVRGEGAALLSPGLFGDLVADGILLQPFAEILDEGDGYHLLRRA
ncbi:MAG: LysR family transcriptional regulator, partial [Sphingomonas sp.]